MSFGEMFRYGCKICEYKTQNIFTIKHDEGGKPIEDNEPEAHTEFRKHMNNQHKTEFNQCLGIDYHLNKCKVDGCNRKINYIYQRNAPQGCQGIMQHTSNNHLKICAYCGKVFSMGGLLQHIKSCETKLRPKRIQIEEEEIQAREESLNHDHQSEFKSESESESESEFEFEFNEKEFPPLGKTNANDQTNVQEYEEAFEEFLEYQEMLEREDAELYAYETPAFMDMWNYFLNLSREKVIRLDLSDGNVFTWENPFTYEKANYEVLSRSFDQFRFDLQKQNITMIF